MTIYLTHDYDCENYIDVRLSAPRRVRDPSGYVWLHEASRHVGVFKREIVKRVFGVLPDDARMLIKIETGELPKGLTNHGE